MKSLKDSIFSITAFLTSAAFNIISIIFSLAPLIILDNSFFVNLCILIALSIPFLGQIAKPILWIYALIYAINTPQDGLSIAYYIIFAISIIPILLECFSVFYMFFSNESKVKTNNHATNEEKPLITSNPFYKKWYFWVIVVLSISVVSLSAVLISNSYFNSDELIPESKNINIISLTDSVEAGHNAYIAIVGKPNTKYKISVYYDSGKSEAAGLEDKYSDGDGIVSWEWKTSPNTNSSKHKIVISGGWEKVTTYFNTYQDKASDTEYYSSYDEGDSDNKYFDNWYEENYEDTSSSGFDVRKEAYERYVLENSN